MKILITGGLGFVGSNLVEYLLKYKNIKKIIIVDNFSSSSIQYIEKFTKYKFFKSYNHYKKSISKVEIIKANINNFNIAKKITKNIDCIIHLAAESGIDKSITDPLNAFNVNVVGTFNYLEAARINKVKQFILASSGAVFGNQKPPFKEIYERNPISPYGSSKLTAETFCQTYGMTFKIQTTILRFSNAYGKYSKHKNSVIAKFINNIINSKQIVINGNGKITRDYIYVEDICSAIYKCLQNKKKSTIYHVSTNKETSLNDLIKKIEHTFNIILNSPLQIKKKYGKNRLGDMKSNSQSNNKIKKEMNWSPKTNLNQGLLKTVEWFILN